MGKKKNISKTILGDSKVNPFRNVGDKKEEKILEEESNGPGRVCHPCYEIDPDNNCRICVTDWGKCNDLKPCCRKVPGCGSCAYAFIATFLGAIVTSIIIW